ncbi:Chemotaxis protein CheY [Novipirellula aureliae]|uniref:Chemotaxis protein CheY n=1 Tax=Novipirellula aureliae TaxID=2527966 RepID=A0A5C6E5U8_9BACT|nr:response regulator [Novipirellula aureliae]TWU44095.1 Chemotaxis protein CheY [Novipirellula aureliae]
MTIVIAEDDPAFRSVLAYTMKRIGFKVECFGDGDAAYGRLQQGNVDLLITDQQMPFCSGVELLKRIACDPSLAGLPAILCTAKGLELDGGQLRSQFNLLSIEHKPISPRKLGNLVGNYFAAT